MNTLLLSPAATITPNVHGVLLQSDLGDFQLHGKDISDFVTTVVPLLQGDNTAQEVCEKLPDYSDSSVLSVIALLKQNGLLEEVEADNRFAPPWAMHQRFMNAWSNKATAENGLNEKAILVIGLEPWSVKMIDELACSGVAHIHIIDNDVVTADDILCHRAFGQHSLGQLRGEVLKAAIAQQSPWCKVTTQSLTKGSHGIDLADELGWDLVVVTLSKEAKHWLYQISKTLHHHALPALYGSLDGLESWIGPAVNLSHATSAIDACWNCLRLRRLGTEQAPDLAHELDKSANNSQQTSRSRSMLTSMAALTGHQLTMEVIKLLSGYIATDLVGKVNVQNLVTSQGEFHKIIPVPWCKVCGYDHSSAAAHASLIKEQQLQHAGMQVGAMSAVAAHQIELTNPLNLTNTVDDVNQLFEGWVDSKTGIIRQLSGHSPQLPDFPVTASASVSNFTSGHYDPRAAGQVGSGKGLDGVSAHISAIGEAIERYSAARYRLEDCHYASISQLTGNYLDPNDLVLYSKKQYHSAQFPFSRWNKKRKIHWSKGVYLGGQEPVWVPSLVSYFNFSCPYEEQFSQVSSNGLAAGQDNDDAAIRATYELIERDAMMLTWYGKQPCQRLKLDAVNHGKMRVMLDELSAMDMTLELYLLDVGIHVPTVVCLAFGDGLRTPAVSVALACHGDIQVAMKKALLEQGHVMPYLCHLMRTGAKVPQHVSEVQSLEDHAAYYFKLNKRSAFDFMRQPAKQAIDIEEWGYPVVKDSVDLNQRLRDAGVEVAIVDVTSPDVALSPFRVARAVGKHMQPIHFGEQFKRVDNPRLKRLLGGESVNMDPHPIA
ncbi:TOMM precursor leader peptide-binding protein [Shewanella sp. KX20019]|uniref:TOMM precursor leader peptide-binding protein n=1 Tax=Shewanella sp. KX20019 TaxID=2803864 RepID=UPI001926B3CE|nr:TOMM precursor leader peptide-binding protein [Shewanella sp. KX20019]QQX81948.1 TOMM precursor leader peptide-binding protein [Shewanella sp. KX20019]